MYNVAETRLARGLWRWTDALSILGHAIHKYGLGEGNDFPTKKRIIAADKQDLQSCLLAWSHLNVLSNHLIQDLFWGTKGDATKDAAVQTVYLYTHTMEEKISSSLTLGQLPLTYQFHGFWNYFETQLKVFLLSGDSALSYGGDGKLNNANTV